MKFDLKMAHGSFDPHCVEILISTDEINKYKNETAQGPTVARIKIFCKNRQKHCWFLVSTDLTPSGLPVVKVLELVSDDQKRCVSTWLENENSSALEYDDLNLDQLRAIDKWWSDKPPYAIYDNPSDYRFAVKGNKEQENHYYYMCGNSRDNSGMIDVILKVDDGTELMYGFNYG